MGKTEKLNEILSKIMQLVIQKIVFFNDLITAYINVGFFKIIIIGK